MEQAVMIVGAYFKSQFKFLRMDHLFFSIPKAFSILALSDLQLESNEFRSFVLVPLAVQHFNNSTRMGYAESPSKYGYTAVFCLLAS